MTVLERMVLDLTTPRAGEVAWNSHGARPDNATRARLYHHLREMRYPAMEALRWSYGPPELPAIEWLEYYISSVAFDSRAAIERPKRERWPAFRLELRTGSTPP